jgi:soluble lytic murein transglycosylase-like protein
MSKTVLGLILAAWPVLAGENVILNSGLRIHVDRHERQGDLFLLYTRDGSTQVPAAAIANFEPDDYVAPAPAPAPPMQVAQVAESAPEIAEPKIPADPAKLVQEAAVRSGLPPEFVESVAKVESGLRVDAVSPKGALGVMQLMPQTARAMNADPRDPSQNIDAGARLLRDLLLRYDGNVVKALAAYNAGTGAVDRYHGLPPYPETQNYVNQVIRRYQQSGGK